MSVSFGAKAIVLHLRRHILVAIVRKFVLLLPLIYIMPQLIADQTMGVYTAEPVADVIAVTFTAILFAIQFKKALNAPKSDHLEEIAQDRH